MEEWHGHTSILPPTFFSLIQLQCIFKQISLGNIPWISRRMVVGIPVKLLFFFWNISFWFYLLYEPTPMLCLWVFQWSCNALPTPFLDENIRRWDKTVCNSCGDILKGVNKSLDGESVDVASVSLSFSESP